MECSCDVDVDIDDGDSCDFAKASLVKARKQHKCSECRSIIEPGTEYENVRGKWDGDFQVYKTCPDCLSLRKEFLSGGYFFEQIWSDFRTFVYSIGATGISESCISRLTTVARDKVCDIIEEFWHYDDSNHQPK